MLDAGLLVTLNSDDPACFGSYAGGTCDAVAAALPFGEDALRGLARNSFLAAFLDDEEELRARCLAEVDAHVF